MAPRRAAFTSRLHMSFSKRLFSIVLTINRRFPQALGQRMMKPNAGKLFLKPLVEVVRFDGRGSSICKIGCSAMRVMT